jgi:hypothetical protein
LAKIQQRNDVLLRERDAFIATLKKERIERAIFAMGFAKCDQNV